MPGFTLAPLSSALGKRPADKEERYRATLVTTPRQAHQQAQSSFRKMKCYGRIKKV
jgi:hypothetical protein